MGVHLGVCKFDCKPAVRGHGTRVSLRPRAIVHGEHSGGSPVRVLPRAVDVLYGIGRVIANPKTAVCGLRSCSLDSKCYPPSQRARREHRGAWHVFVYLVAGDGHCRAKSLARA